jgi:hypothetical protein
MTSCVAATGKSSTARKLPATHSTVAASLAERSALIRAHLEINVDTSAWHFDAGTFALRYAQSSLEQSCPQQLSTLGSMLGTKRASASLAVVLHTVTLKFVYITNLFYGPIPRAVARMMQRIGFSTNAS